MTQHDSDGFAAQDVPHPVFEMPVKPPPSSQPDWYLIDLTVQPDGLRVLFSHDPAPHYELVYLHAYGGEVALHGPLLVEPLSNECRDWLTDGVRNGCALALTGGAGLSQQDVCAHLASLDNAETPYGQTCFVTLTPAVWEVLVTP